MRVRTEECEARPERAIPGPGARVPGLRLGLSARVFLITVAFVAVAEVLIYVPAVANYRLSLLSDRIAAAQVAAMVLDASQGQAVPDDLARHLLVGAGARVIAVRGDTTQRLLSLDPVPERVADMVDLRDTSIWEAIRGAWRTIAAPADAPIRVVGHGRDGFDLVEVLIDEAPLRQAIVDFALRLLLSSLIVAAAAAGVVFVVLQVAIVRPVRRLARNIAAFADDPEGAERSIVPSHRTDEIGVAETALARMAQGLADQLRQKKRLAELGLAVSKINHELRNLLTGAQLLGDRLEGAADPTVQRVAPRLLAALDRAIRFCEATLAYGRASEPSPSPRRVALAPLLAELEDQTGLAAGAGVAIRIEAPAGLEATVDPEQLARALTNLVRNAVQALDGGGTTAPEVRVTACRGCIGGRGTVTILVADNGPGLPERARAHLFAPFKGSTRAGGTGLGLAVASELIRLNGGSLTLDEGTRGACFRVTLPDAA
ncbi:ATPase [Methylobacterium gregans]|uniref:sensor histidine kinase n=1 Tax=Methylobacterium gregans TaxID=374424 RepID=UPI00235C5A8E|nr:HAMP domain-containing sensor histidine kinase [Methylobacterium gregans]MDQ0519099.1 signal transduction histidine kinase [Methylobacterium gregans]GLS53726.1 ATPase [Methylobacterium gregans]